ncbi:alpha/beta fold hydrolase [Salinisphaera aquimarina]|uniref:Alpha/beta fold hydrolase n=1 Tax=Salinisphaera aquimarina TaxID=2094031 RepID=A0ABV7EWY6_9GAMM
MNQNNNPGAAPRVVVLVMALLLTQASTADTTAPGDEATSAPLPGHLVDVAGHRMYLDCEGSAVDHGATVIFDSGLGDSAVVWARVQPTIAGFTRACSYDRAGYGESDARRPPRTSTIIVSELHQLLARADIAPPYVLVGHSFGGWNMQLYASTYPQDVAALVLVDSSQVNQIERYQRDVGATIAPKGDFHFTMTPFVPPDLPPLAAERARELTYDPVTWRTAHHEFVAFRVSEAEVAAARPLPRVPIIVVSRGAAIDASDTRHAERERLWRTLQQEFVDAHPGSVHFVARNSGHYIQLQQPQLVIYSICLALERAHEDSGDCALPVPPASLRPSTTAASPR